MSTGPWIACFDAQHDGLYWLENIDGHVDLARLEDGYWRYFDERPFRAPPKRCRLISSPED
jgi:hypothetical protein